MNPDLKRDLFEIRHIGPDEPSQKEMLEAIGCNTLDQLIRETIPEDILLDKKLNLLKPCSEYHFIRDFRKLASKNVLFKNYIGCGYYETVLPSVIQRNILENPGWYTSYTPYQAEISQGRLEALLNFQTMVIDLTGMEIANASLLDEATAAAEAMSLILETRRANRKKGRCFFIAEPVLPQTLEVLKTRAKPLGIEIETGCLASLDISREDVFGILLSYPDADGSVLNLEPFIQKANEEGVGVAVAADLLSLTLIKPPGEMGADVVVGSTQRFGIPLGYGGPHAAYFATKDTFKRQVPGRMIGVSKDRLGKPAFRMALQTREQHIRREKATSNICTSQVLLAIMAGAYAVYHGPEGLKRIARRIHALAAYLERNLIELGFEQENSAYFDTLKIRLNSTQEKEAIRNALVKNKINVRYFDDECIGISLDQGKDPSDVKELIEIISLAAGKKPPENMDNDEGLSMRIPEELMRISSYLDHPVFKSYQSEHEMLRYLKKLENRDISLAQSMISLGSCTMKLNATTEMLPVSWPEICDIHPLAPGDQTEGYKEIIRQLSEWLAEITGFKAVSLQPNSGAQGEYAGLLSIRSYHESRGEGHRNVTLIPSSAHGTNPASAVMAGMEVVITACDENGNIDIEDLRRNAEKHSDRLAAVMITYPSTHGVYEEAIREICSIIHVNGGQVYMDGANMNAQVGLTTPAQIGADVCHLNLHKTFSIPHGGGGPGVGPICVAEHLENHLPGHHTLPSENYVVSATAYGSAGILPISYAYIRMMGAKGLTRATKVAILNANYIKERLKGHYTPLYVGKNGRVAHEMIIELRNFRQEAGIEVADVAKRLVDYGFHAPTVSFPVPGTMMIEPSESEVKEEMDRFCDALIAIRKEIENIKDGTWDRQNNPLKNAPHTAEMIASDSWEYPYSRETAAYPLPWIRERKFWPYVTRIDEVYGDRNLMCHCPPTESYRDRGD
ncbi:aminomethyl-transferring glycine dehydrogenase [Balneolaceae bacterium ANBcel3]|nr:aminomethyl-transferring glycine dehydrogenase [Balneolaceae bacterium ANBcel3]